MSAGYPGSVHDSRMLRNSWLYNAANNEDILDAPHWFMNESVHLKPYLVGGVAYPFSRWLMKSFPYRKSMPEHQNAFNLALSQARVSIERAFGVLKERWRVLLGKVCLEPSLTVDLVIACIVFHNICQERNEPDETVVDPYADMLDVNAFL
eukprot:gene20755-22781_t